MSFMHLLTVGRSLKPVKDKPSPFRMKQPILLPKFGPKPSVDADRDLAEAIPDAGSSAALVKDIQTEAVREIKAQVQRNWFLFRKAGKGAMVQTELSLDSVRVVRNDLQESGQARSSGKNPFVRRNSKQTVTVAGQWWTRLQERLFARGRKQD